MTRTRLALCLAVVCVALLGVACSDEVAGAGDTPGFSDSDRQIEDGPFRMAEPDDRSASTTIPGPGPTLHLPERDPVAIATTSIPGTTAIPGTTTTFPMPQSVVRPGTPTSFCGYSEYLYSLVSIFINPEVDPADAVRGAEETIEAYRLFTPAAAISDVALVSDTVLGLIEQLEAVAYDINEARFRGEIVAIIRGDARYAQFLRAYERVQVAEGISC